MQTLSISDAVARVGLLSKIEPGTHARLLEQLRLERYESGAHIILMGDLGKDILLMVHGRAYVTRSEPNGKEVIVAQLEEGMLFGEIAALTTGDRSAYVVAASDCSVLRLAKDDFDQILLADPGFVRKLLVTMAERVRAATDRIADLALLDVNGRVLKALKNLSEPSLKRPEYSSVVKRRPTHAELANMVGTSREVVTRTLKRLQAEQVILISGSSLFLR